MNIFIDVSLWTKVNIDGLSKKQIRKMQRDVRLWVKELLENEASFIPFYYQEDGDTVEGTTEEAKVKLKKNI